MPSEGNPFRDTWKAARAQGMTRQAMADALDVDRGRLNDLILGRERPRLAEVSALTGKRSATMISWKDEDGNWHSFYTGRGMSLQRLIETGEVPEIASETGAYSALASIERAQARFPKHPPQTRVWSVSRTLRRELGQRR